LELFSSKREKTNPPTTAQGNALQNSRRLSGDDGLAVFLDGAVLFLSPLSALLAFDIPMRRFLAQNDFEVKKPNELCREMLLFEISEYFFLNRIF
jgi:hypothetical protein